MRSLADGETRILLLMGRQVNFYLHPGDYLEMEDLLKSAGDVLFLPHFHDAGTVRTIQHTLPDDMTKEGTRVYLVRPQDLEKITLQHMEKVGYWLVDDNYLPVLHYDRLIDRLYLDAPAINGFGLVVPICYIDLFFDR